MTPVSFAEAARFWIRLGFISFGGPAGQIAILHREVVEQKRWLDERAFVDALNFCMLLPGPEALQLAIYLGWRLHGTRGGLVAGLAFILPAIVLLLVLSWIYAAYGHVATLAGVLLGLKAAVLGLVLQALERLGRRALRTRVHGALAVGALVAMLTGGLPFPVLMLGAALAGYLITPRSAALAAPPLPVARIRGVRVLGTAAVLWLAPLLLVAGALGPDSIFARIYLFFSKAALVTFGGAYAVLGYVTQHLVHDLGWVTAEQSVAGLALAETTPGPLVIVLQFMGFMAGWSQPAPLAAGAAAILAALLAAWATFLPSFAFIFAGAPYVERLAHAPRISGALAAITAAVVGVIAALLAQLVVAVLWPQGMAAGIDVPALVIALAAAMLLRTSLALRWVLALCAIAGVVSSTPIFSAFM